MKLFEGLETITEPFPSSTVAIGTFDGIHVGHQAIITAAVQDASANKRTSLVFTFDRHPAELLAPERAPEYLMTPQQRNRYVAGLGVDGLVIAAFDRGLAELSPDLFLQQILRAQLGAKAIVVGENFAFGKNRSGDVGFLKAAQQRFGYSLRALAPVMVAGSPASSTRVRELLNDGEIREAELVLGHAYWLAGTVVEGRRLGRHLGFPTANLELQCRQVVPRDGIYAVRVRLDSGRLLDGACSIGDRPTIVGAGRSIETYLLDFDQEIYGHSLEIRFVRRQRDEKRFDSLDALKIQMASDAEESRQILSSEPDYE